MDARILRLTALFLLCAGALPGQSPSLDSLRELFRYSTDDSLRRELTARIATEYSFIQADSALAWAERGLRIAETLGNEDELGKSYYHLGMAARNKQDLTAAMEHFLRAIDLFRSTGNNKWMIDSEYEMSVIYQKMGDFASAKQYLDRFYQYYLKEEDPASIIFALNQYNQLYEQMNMPDSMLYYAKETLKAAQKYNQTKYLSKIHNNLAATYLYQEDIANARFHLREAEKTGFGEDVSGLYFNQYTQADLYRVLGKPDSSILFARRALEAARAYGDLGREARMHHLLSELYVEKEDFQDAYEQLLTYIQLKDSITIMRHQQNLTELSVQYETQQKEAQIAQQQLQLEREANRRNLIILSALACLAAAGALFFFWQNRQRSRQQQAEMELRLKASEAKRLRELDQMKSNFFANISHEFRTPLALMLGPLREMVGGTFKGDVKKYQKMMIRNGERLLDLVNQLLDLSRLESGRMQLDLQAADLTRFLKSVVFSFESWAMRKQIFFQSSFPKQEIIALFDSDKLEKIISNLLSNALKFTPEKGRINFELSVLEQQENRIEVEIKVKDSGAGIPPEQLPFIFDRFYSQPREDQDMRGSGIGLALTKELIVLYGGDIRVESEPGRGALFTIRMPFQPAAGADVVPAASAAVPGIVETTDHERSGPKALNSDKPILLIVEDNPDLRTYVKDKLNLSYQVVEAVNGRQGLDLAVEIIPDLILTDVMMPEIDGLTLCRELKANERTSHVPVVILTARSDQEDKISGLSTGADAYLTKPFDARELHVVVHNLIDQRRKLREKFAAGLTDSNQRRLDFVSPAEEAFLSKVAGIVEARLDDENFSIEDLGKAVGMSRSQLHRKIKAITNQSPSVFVRTLRLRHAYQLLEQRAGNISEVAFQVGMPNLAYFSRSFSEQFGFPPSTLLQD